MTEDLGLAGSLAVARAEREARRDIPSAVLNSLAHAGIAVTDREVLDLGAGLGGMSEALVLAGARVSAVEPGAAWAEVARKRVERHGGRFQLREDFGEAMPFGDASFDLIVSLQVLEHTKDPRRVLAEAWRVLRPGGHFFLACENYLAFREGHYQVAWLPLLPKPLGSLYLSFRGRPPRFLNEAVTYTTYPGVMRACRRLGFVRLRDDEFATRLRGKPGLKGGVVRTLDYVTRGRAPFLIDLMQHAFKFGISELFHKPLHPIPR
jgi:SAM-dependent methyltransferase